MGVAFFLRKTSQVLFGLFFGYVVYLEYHTNLDVKQEKRIDDYWNIDGLRDLSDSRTGFIHFILFPKQQVLPGQIIHGQNSGQNFPVEGGVKVVTCKVPLGERTKIAYFIDFEDKDKETIKNVRKKLETPMVPAMFCKTSKKSEHGKTRGKTNDVQINICVYAGSWWIYETAYGRIIADSPWRPYCRKRWKFITALQFGSQIYSYASSYEDFRSESSGGQGIGKIGENFGVEPDESQK